MYINKNACRICDEEKQKLHLTLNFNHHVIMYLIMLKKLIINFGTFFAYYDHMKSGRGKTPPTNNIDTEL